MKSVLSKDLRALSVERRQSLGPCPDGFTDLRDVLACEQEVLWVHVARLHEAARLLRTAARVRRVHQPAPVVHEAVQLTARAGDALAEVRTADLEELGSDDVGPLERLSQHV